MTTNGIQYKIPSVSSSYANLISILYVLLYTINIIFSHFNNIKFSFITTTAIIIIIMLYEEIRIVVGDFFIYVASCFNNHNNNNKIDVIIRFYKEGNR